MKADAPTDRTYPEPEVPTPKQVAADPAQSTTKPFPKTPELLKREEPP
jgi:hypothetical protein